MTVSWAEAAKKRSTATQKQTDSQYKDLGFLNQKVAVLDSSVFIHGVSLNSLGIQSAVSVEEIIGNLQYQEPSLTSHGEIKDQRARQQVETIEQELGKKLQVMQPDSISYKKVFEFAKVCGEVSKAFSKVDLKLLALAYYIQKNYHGELSLNTDPPQVQAVKSKPKQESNLPGWDDFNEADEEWYDDNEGSDNDQTNNNHEYNNDENIKNSKKLNQIFLEDSNFDTDKQQNNNYSFENPQQVQQEQQKEQLLQQDTLGLESQDEKLDISQNISTNPPQSKDSIYKSEELSDLQNENFLRMQNSDQSKQKQIQEQSTNSTNQLDGSIQSGQNISSKNSLQEEDTPSSNCLPNQINQLEGNVKGLSIEQQEQSQGTQIILITADFSIQNLAIQMGIKVVNPDGRYINRLSRYALKCKACAHMELDSTRIFCAKCGNTTLQRVEIEITKDGIKEYVNRNYRNILKGTRYSIPKPKGGHNNKDPILREDEMKQKLGLIKRQIRSKQKGPNEMFESDLPDEAFVKINKPQNMEQFKYLFADYKHNPNQRQNGRSSRRK